MKTENFKIASGQSNIDWIGRKVTGAHNGTIAIKEGALIFTDKLLTGGKFSIDTSSIKILDVTDPATNAQFAGHLASDDFFSIEKYPTAQFVITSVKQKGEGAYYIGGDLSIKDITKPVFFDAEVKKDENSVKASGKIIVDRTAYGIKFRSGNFFKDLGDTLIYNDFELNVSLTAEAGKVAA